MTIEPMLFGDFFKDSIFVDGGTHPAMERDWPRVPRRRGHGAARPSSTLPFWLALAGVVVAYVLYIAEARRCRRRSRARFGFVYRVLDNKYYIDWFNENVLAPAGARHGPGLVEGRRPGADRRR